MKTTTTFSVLLLVFVFSTATATKEAVPVVDTDGDPLRTGVQYYVVPFISFTGGGGLILGHAPFRTPSYCPEAVVHSSWWDNGMPVIFSNADANDNVVRLSSDVNIEFFTLGPRSCPEESTVWKLDDYDAYTGKWWVVSDGVKGNPGPNTLTNWFKIESGLPSGAYKFRFCPSVCDSCLTLCKDIGIYDDEGQARLALTHDRAWRWVFKKANRTTMQ